MRKEVKLRVWGSWRSLKVDEGWSVNDEGWPVNKDGRIGSSFLLAGGLAHLSLADYIFSEKRTIRGQTIRRTLRETEAGFDMDDPWFFVDTKKAVTYLDSGLWLVDAGDYDNDGKSELIFSINRENVRWIRNLVHNFKKQHCIQIQPPLAL